ncbi:hypothetical protein [Mycolicibacterium holsaticum]|uniref:hypothetical protein n=1 Tax=Mycolicibacterium holsaticum TaxID=152142 RepID=UPI001C7D65F3|nr:hypothetical protein [Mycolicibacterium holsaticum]MDA4109720.1 hypothetical protein [Mycolicibacterium holsaticum DSM 44478 = JCM 12374]QZA10645.1 hypothetical protein K3U96_15270 [Mycolicibacterium holsaticum DSM 44478 = JCM 12374]UNC11850.1 hypothetical protein H5U41_11560 [Mycolicibacterium holsaticum DSM 44478 = JCM 12374]
MADDPTKKLDDYLAEFLAEGEKRMSAIQDQITTQFDAQSRAITERFDEHWKAVQKAFADASDQAKAAQQGTANDQLKMEFDNHRRVIEERWAAQQKAALEAIEQHRIAYKKAFDNIRNSVGGIVLSDPNR